MRRRRHINLAATAASVLLMQAAVGLCLVTVAEGGYRDVLLAALACAGLALCCLAIPLVRGPAAWRVAAVVLGSPAAFVVSEFVARGGPA